jgi:hypothetical protein
MTLTNSPTSSLDCGKPPCTEHGTLCAYHGDEKDRCPWCHSTWGRILGSGSHSCESPAVWTNGKRPDNAQYVAERVFRAAVMRQKAAERPQGPWQSGHCSHGYSDIPPHCAMPARAQVTPEGASHE